jgi:hypothetical protein
MFEEGPGSLSPSLYWWRNGAFTVIPTRLQKGELTISPPPDFVDVVSALSRGAR